ncbi:MAG: cytochrome c oxidase subunit II [Hyphomicrobiales bacterium]|nr:cytochrome c oxidase subunit II [Hyphomicrobiales bacterium]
MDALDFFPEAASTQATSTDFILFVLIGFTGIVVLSVLSLLVIFSIRFRRHSAVRRDDPPEWMKRDLEIGWSSAGLFLALFLAWWTSATELSALIAPKNALEIHVVAKQWMWKAQHQNGAREINALHVPVDEPVRLIMTSQDVIHSFFVPEFRMKQDVLPGRDTRTWFQATKTGTFHLFCTQLCGTEHARMTGEVVVMSGPDFAHWLTSQPVSDDLTREGEALFRSLGCSGCHDAASRVQAPALAGFFGSEVRLANGTSVTGSDELLRDTVLHPREHSVAGYPSVMPSYAGIVGDEELLRLSRYIHSLSPSPEGKQP